MALFKRIMKKTIYILSIFLLFTQCVKEEIVKPKEVIGKYDRLVIVSAPSIIKYNDFELHTENFSTYNPTNFLPPFSEATMKVTRKTEEQKFNLSTLPGAINSGYSHENLSKYQAKEIVVDSSTFRIIFIDFVWDKEKSNDDIKIVDKGRFYIEKVK